MTNTNRHHCEDALSDTVRVPVVTNTYTITFFTTKKLYEPCWRRQRIHSAICYSLTPFLHNSSVLCLWADVLKVTQMALISYASIF